METALFITQRGARDWANAHVEVNSTAVTEIFPMFKRRALVGWALFVNGLPVTDDDMEYSV